MGGNENKTYFYFDLTMLFQFWDLPLSDTYVCFNKKPIIFSLYYDLLVNQIQHIVESIGVLNNNHQTYF